MSSIKIGPVSGSLAKMTLFTRRGCATDGSHQVRPSCTKVGRYFDGGSPLSDGARGVGRRGSLAGLMKVSFEVVAIDVVRVVVVVVVMAVVAILTKSVGLKLQRQQKGQRWTPGALPASASLPPLGSKAVATQQAAARGDVLRYSLNGG